MMKYLILRRYAIVYFLILFHSAIFSQGVGKGTRIDLTSKLQLNAGTSGQFAQLFIPDYYSPPQDGKFMLVFHFHSASWAAEDEVYKSHTNAVLFNIHLGGFSSSYQNYFIDQNKFRKILDTVLSTLSSNSIINDPEIDNLLLTTFSAGYAGVREILKSTDYYGMIDALTLADGLHCNSDPATKEVQMRDFLKFAKDARDKKKIMLLTHSSITTSGYENTTQTANYLINGIGSIRVSYSNVDEIGTQYSRCDTGYFQLKGYLGTTAEDHLKHLYAMNKMLEQAVDILLTQPTEISDQPIKNDSYYFFQNYPNPFNPTTKIRYVVPASLNPSQGETLVSLKVFDIIGNEISTLVNEDQTAGEYEIVFDGKNLSSGIYFYKLETEGFTQIKKMLLLK